MRPKIAKVVLDAGWTALRVLYMTGKTPTVCVAHEQSAMSLAIHPVNFRYWDFLTGAQSRV